MDNKQLVLAWLKENCYGFRNAKFRHEILAFFPGLSDRLFRRIISDLKHDGNVGATNDRGYWFIPLVMYGENDQAEINAARNSVNEMKSKALDMLRDSSKLEARLDIMEGKEADLFTAYENCGA